MFLLRRGEIEGRLDTFYYYPPLLIVERKVRARATRKLKDFTLSISSGATPLKSEAEKFYTDKSGIPLLRVQNITDEGINLKDLVYITHETHNTYLKRSQIRPNNLIVTITGRLASAAVAPENFEANINQHSVVIQTESLEVSEYLAIYLNSDIGQKLALRRATGATRPALDYSALRSIPIIVEPSITIIMQKAYAAKRAREAEARELLESIDNYILGELGITLPDEHKEATFRTSLRNVLGGRFDPYFSKEYFTEMEYAVYQSKYKPCLLKTLVSGRVTKGYLPKNEEKGGKNKVVQINSIQTDGSIILDDVITAQDVFIREQLLSYNDILVVITGATIGKIAFWDNAEEYWLGGDIVKFQTNQTTDSYFVYSYLRTTPAQVHIKRHITGATNGHLSPQEVANVLIPLPPIAVQESIAAECRRRREQARALEQSARTIIEEAKREVEKIILGEEE